MTSARTSASLVRKCTSEGHVQMNLSFGIDEHLVCMLCVAPAATFPLSSARHIDLSAQRECAYGGDWAGGCVRRVIACCSEAMAVT